MGGGETTLQDSVHIDAYVLGCFDERLRSWFTSVGLDMHTLQERLTDCVPREGDAHLYWHIFLSGLMRALSTRKADYVSPTAKALPPPWL